MNDMLNFLNSRNPTEEYDFMDCKGQCLIGQYMASKGEKWHFSRYLDISNTLVGETNMGAIASGFAPGMTSRGNWTMGEAKKRLVRALEPA